MADDDKTNNTGETKKPDKSPNSIRQQVSEAYAKLGLSDMPHLYAPEGITFDFCWGYRIFIPDTPVRAKYRVRVWDLDDEHLCYDGVVGRATWVQSDQHYFKRYAIEVDDGVTGEKVFTHKFDLQDRPVLVNFPVETVGDTLAWFPSVVEFKHRRNCKVFVAMADHMRKLLEPANPEITFIDRKAIRSLRPYAMYQMGVTFDGNESVLPYDWRLTPLHWLGANLLGLDPMELNDARPKVNVTEGERLVKEPYVCIGTMASGGCKLWLNPEGWDKTVAFLKDAGYRVIDIDGKDCTGSGFAFQKIPAGAENWTGRGEGKELADRARLLRDCDFFVGVGSGLSWLAWAMCKPVVLISGFSQPFCEFHTPYRVINTYVCHGCFNDVRYEFDGKDSYWCPKHKGTDKQLICSLAITSAQVINTIKRIPEYNMQIERRLREQDIVSPVKAQETETQTVVEQETSGEDAKEWQVRSTCTTHVPDDEEKASAMPPMRVSDVIRPGDPGAKEMFERVQRFIEQGED